MKSGTYAVSFNVDIRDCDTYQEGVEAIKEMLSDMLDKSEFVDLEFNLVEESFPEYDEEEPELEELDFEDAV